MKKNTKTPAGTRKTNQQQKRRHELNIGELEQIYGGQQEDDGTKG